MRTLAIVAMVACVVGVGVGQVATAEVLFVADDIGDIHDAESYIISRLHRLGYSAHPIDEGTAVPAGYETTYQLLVTTSDIDSGSLDKYRDTSVPVISSEAYMYDNWNWAGSGDAATESGQQDLVIVNPTHPLAAGLSGTVAVYSSGQDMMYHPNGPGPSADVIAQTSSGRPVLFAYDAGDALPGSDAGAPTTSPAKGIGFFFAEDGHQMNANGWALFDAAANYAGGAPPVTPGPVSATGFTSDDVGGPSTQGWAGYVPSTGTYIVQGGGDDIWGSHDEFQFVHQAHSGDFDATVRLNSLLDTNGWAKAGFMAREDLTGGSRHVNVSATPENAVALQGRPTSAGSGSGQFTNTLPDSPPNTTQDGSAPIWLRLRRVGNTFSAQWAPDAGGSPGTWSGAQSSTVALNADVEVGLHVLSHNDNRLNSGLFDNLEIVAPRAEIGARGYHVPISACAVDLPSNSARGPVTWQLETLSPYQALRTPGGAPGLRAEWFDNDDFSGTPDFDVVATEINRADGEYPGTTWTGDHDYFSVRYTGQLYAPADGSYLFGEHVDDECWLDIDGSEVHHDDTWDSDTTVSVALTEGWHDVEFRTREGNGGDYAVLSWDGGTGGSLYVLAAFDDAAELVGEGSANVGGPGYLGLTDVLLPMGEHLLRLTVGYDGMTASVDGTFLAVPEPATCLLVGVGVVALARRRRRR